MVIDGCPPRLELDEETIQRDLDRRRPGQSDLVTPRKEADRCRILSGVFEGRTLGTPILVLVPNEDARPEAYSEMATAFRPSHADYTYQAKYGIRNWQGGGRSSARETIGRVAAAAVAKVALAALCPGLEIVAYVRSIHTLDAVVDSATVTLAQVESNPVRCPDLEIAGEMAILIRAMRARGDSVGGVVECVVRGVPPGLGEPVFDRLEADLAKGMLSLPATRGFEIGSGFAATRMTGSEHNDAFEMRDGRVRTATKPLRRRAGRHLQRRGPPVPRRLQAHGDHRAVPEKPSPRRARTTELAARGRHDPCVLPRAVPMVEAMTALVLVDHALRQRAVHLA